MIITKPVELEESVNSVMPISAKLISNTTAHIMYTVPKWMGMRRSEKELDHHINVVNDVLIFVHRSCLCSHWFAIIKIIRTLCCYNVIIYYSIDSVVCSDGGTGPISISYHSINYPRKHLLHIFVSEWFSFVFLVFVFFLKCFVYVFCFAKVCFCCVTLLFDVVVFGRHKKKKKNPLRTIRNVCRSSCRLVIDVWFNCGHQNINKDRKTEASYRCGGHLVYALREWWL